MILPVLSAPMLLCGCASVTEAGERSFAQIMAIDGKRVSLSLYDGEVCSGEGETPFAAAADAQAASGKNISQGHVELLLLSDGDYIEMLTGFLRGGTPAPSCGVAYCSEPEEYCSAEPPLPEYLEINEKNLMLCQKNICRTLDGLVSVSQCAAVPYIDSVGTGMAIIGTSGIQKTLGKDASRGIAVMSGAKTDTVGKDDTRITKVSCSVSAALTRQGLNADFCVTVKCPEPPADKKALTDDIKKLCEAALTETASCGYDVLEIEKALGNALSDISAEEWRTLLRAGDYNVRVKTE